MQIYFAAKMCSVVIIFDSFSCLGRVVLPNRMNFEEKNPNGLRLPPLIFGKLYCNSSWQIWLHLCEAVWWLDSNLNSEVPSSKCVLFWVLSIQLLKKHTLNPEIANLCLFFYFLTFEKADCSIFTLSVGRLVGWLVGRRHH